MMSKKAQFYLSVGKSFLIMYLIWLGAFILTNFLNSIYLPEYFRPYWEIFVWSLIAAAVLTFLCDINKDLLHQWRMEKIKELKK